jgi:hypothetical protein
MERIQLIRQLHQREKRMILGIQKIPNGGWTLEDSEMAVAHARAVFHLAGGFQNVVPPW